MKKSFSSSIGKSFACFAALLISAAVVFTGCASVSAKDVAEVEEQEAEQTVRDQITIAMESEPPTLHPFDHSSVTAGYMNALTYNCLFIIDADTLEPVPSLCESYENISDTEWLFKIYDNINFHDGSHMTAEDVKASMEYARTYPTTKNYTSFWTDVEVVDEYTIKVTTDGPYALTLSDMASIKIVPKALIDSGNDFNQNPIGSGPYRFVQWKLGDCITFVKNDDYFDKGHQPTITDMTWRIIPEGSSRTIALEAGEIDVIIETEANDIARLEEDPDVTVYNVDGTRLNVLAMNNEVYPFNNVDFRRAVNAAIDRDAVIAVACNGMGTKAVAQTPSIFEGCTEAGAQDYDIEKAKEYLERSGVDADGLVFSCIVANDAARRTAEVIQAGLQEIGITMEIENMDYATQLSAIMSGDYQTSISGYTSSNMCAFLRGFFHSNAIDAANIGRVNDGELDSLIDLSESQIDRDARIATYEKATERLNELSPHLPLYQSVVTRAASSRLGGFKVSAAGGMRFEDVYWME